MCWWWRNSIWGGSKGRHSRFWSRNPNMRILKGRSLNLFWGCFCGFFCKSMAHISSHMAAIASIDECTVTGSATFWCSLMSKVRMPSCDSGSSPTVFYLVWAVSGLSLCTGRAKTGVDLTSFVGTSWDAVAPRQAWSGPICQNTGNIWQTSLLRPTTKMARQSCKRPLL